MRLMWPSRIYSKTNILIIRVDHALIQISSEPSNKVIMHEDREDTWISRYMSVILVEDIELLPIGTRLPGHLWP